MFYCRINIDNCSCNAIVSVVLPVVFLVQVGLSVLLILLSNFPVIITKCFVNSDVTAIRNVLVGLLVVLVFLLIVVAMSVFSSATP